MTRTPLFACTVLLAACGSLACGAVESSPSDGPEIARSTLARDDATSVSPETLAALAEADNAFTFDVFGKARADLATKNAVLSPLSVSLALSMTLAGARGETATELAKALHLDGLGARAHAANNALDLALAARAGDALTRATESAKGSGGAAPAASDFRLHVVNSVWGDRSYAWEAPFLDTLAKSYGAGVFLADYVHAYEAERTKINGWVSEQTQKKINDLLSPGSIDGDTRMVLVNAVHLKLPWEQPFERSMTKSGDFTRADGTKVSADYLQDTRPLAYFEDDRAQVASIPLAGRALSLVVARPKASLAAFESGLDATWWKGAASKLVTQDVSLSLPKFDFTSPSIKLRSVLSALGVKSAFSPTAADFLGMCGAPPNGERLYVSEVLHKAMMAVDEHGVEAAAATAVVMAGATSIGEGPKKLTLDRPFVTAIVDEPTGAILFLGHIADPTDKGGS